MKGINYNARREEKRREEKRRNDLTALSVISAIAVVILHTNGCFWSFSTHNYWARANIIECLFYFAVPIFFMISGATLIDYNKRYSDKIYFTKRFKKTFIPFIFWSLIGLVFCAFYLKSIDFSTLSLQYVFNGIFETKFIHIYWFFIPLFCAYLIIPLLSAVENDKKNKIFSYICCTGCVLNFAIPFIFKIFDNDMSFPIKISTNDLFIYFLLGWIFTHNELSKKLRYTIYGFAIVGLLEHIIGTYCLSMKAGMIIKTFKGYSNLPCLLYSVGIFIFIKEIFKKDIPQMLQNILNFLSKYTFSIYLLHWFYLQILSKLPHVSTTNLLFSLGAPFVIIPLCIITTFIIRKIPFGKYILP